MDCLSLALRCAPSSALQEILNAYRRCEEELEMKVREEEEEEDAWDEQGTRSPLTSVAHLILKQPTDRTTRR